MTVRIVEFTDRHAKGFETLNRAWLVGMGLYEPPDEDDLAHPRRAIIDRGGAIFVAEAEGRVVGTAALVPHGAHALELRKVAVDPSIQRQGIARQLMQRCIEWARARRATDLVLCSNSQLVAALRLYESMGFVHKPLPSDIPYTTADVWMELSL